MKLREEIPILRQSLGGRFSRRSFLGSLLAAIPSVSIKNGFIMRTSDSPQEAADVYIYKTLKGQYFSFCANKILDFHYALLFDADHGDLKSFKPAEHLYSQLLSQDRDFNFLWQQIRYPLCQAGNMDQLNNGLQSMMASLATEISQNLENRFTEYDTELFPIHQPLFDAAVEFLRMSFLPHETLLYQKLSESLHYSFHPPMPVYFVGLGTALGGYTSQPSLTVLNVAEMKGMDLAEMVLHEVVHGAVDINHTDVNAASTILQTQLNELGKSNRFNAAWHALIFWNAGEIVRRYLDPSHVHYGDSHGVYKRAFARERQLYDQYWSRYLDGKIALKDALHQVATGL